MNRQVRSPRVVESQSDLDVRDRTVVGHQHRRIGNRVVLDRQFEFLRVERLLGIDRQVPFEIEFQLVVDRVVVMGIVDADKITAGR